MAEKETKNDDVQKTIGRLLRANQDLNNKVENNESTIKTLEKENGDLTVKVEMLEGQKRELITYNDFLNDEHAHFKELQEKIEWFEGNRKHLEGMIEKHQQIIAEKIGLLQKENEELKLQIKEMGE